MYILANMWFQKLMIQFFFNIDKMLYGFISQVYDLLMSISRTSVLSQANIIGFADRIYKLLAVFMIFKVTFSLIVYIVNPDDFSEKGKGIGKLSSNIIISLCLLVLTPYIFNYAYELQTIILEENTIAKLVMGDNTENDFLNTAGDEITYITLSAFFSPNTSLEKLYDCSTLVVKNEDGSVVFNPDCSGLDGDDADSLMNLTSDASSFTETMLRNYVMGVENANFGLMFRQDLALATDPDNENFIMDYKYIISTAVGVVVLLLLITFCMDIAVRSIKLAFLQLVAPIPIISYIDPKSGKDGMFKKWYQMCFKTFISLFVRLLALFFAIYIISKVAELKMVDLVDGSYQTNKLVAIFIIIGALMFAKELPKILEGLGIKLDGGGKFTLNPLKKIENDAIGGKHIAKGAKNVAKGATGLAMGGALGLLGAASGAGAGRILGGMASGLSSGLKGKKLGEIRKAQFERNSKMRQARLDGSTFGGRLSARVTGAVGMPTESERIEAQIHGIDESVKESQNEVKALELERDSKKTVYKEDARKAQIIIKSMSDAKTTFVEKLKDGTGQVGAKYRNMLNTRDTISGQVGNIITFTDVTTGTTVTREVTESDVAAVNNKIADLEQNGWKDLVDEIVTGVTTDSKLSTKMDVVYQDYATAHGVSVADAKTAINSGGALNTELGTQSGVASRAEASQRKIDEDYYDRIKSKNDSIADLEEQKRQLYEEQRKAKADETAIK